MPNSFNNERFAREFTKVVDQCLLETFIKNNLFLIFSCALMMALVLFRKATPYFIGLWFLSAVYESFQKQGLFFSLKSEMESFNRIALFFCI